MGTVREIKISRDFKEYGTTKLVPFSLGINFTINVIKFPTPIHSDAAVATVANGLLSIHDGRQISPGKTVTANEQVQLNILRTMLDENADYAEPVANRYAAVGADENIAINLITALGYNYYIKEGYKRGEGFIDHGPGWAHAHEANAVDTREIHHFEFGAATTMNTPPTTTKIISLPVGDIIFTNINSGTILAYRHASTTSVSKKSGTSTPTTPTGSSTSKVVSSIPVNKAKHPVIDFSNPIQLVFGSLEIFINKIK